MLDAAVTRESMAVAHESIAVTQESRAVAFTRQSSSEIVEGGVIRWGKPSDSFHIAHPREAQVGLGIELQQDLLDPGAIARGCKRAHPEVRCRSLPGSAVGRWVVPGCRQKTVRHCRLPQHHSDHRGCPARPEDGRHSSGFLSRTRQAKVGYSL